MSKLCTKSSNNFYISSIQVLPRNLITIFLLFLLDLHFLNHTFKNLQVLNDFFLLQMFFSLVFDKGFIPLYLDSLDPEFDVM